MIEDGIWGSICTLILKNVTKNIIYIWSDNRWYFNNDTKQNKNSGSNNSRIKK